MIQGSALRFRLLALGVVWTSLSGCAGPDDKPPRAPAAELDSAAVLAAFRGLDHQAYDRFLTKSAAQRPTQFLGVTADTVLLDRMFGTMQGIWSGMAVSPRDISLAEFSAALSSLTSMGEAHAARPGS
ncbi:hypothetical protein ACXYUI_26365, partial [Klebsiella pneumoniae]